MIDSRVCWLAASPDGLLQSNDGTVGILEVKCPFSARYGAGKNAWVTFVDGKMMLHRQHAYYNQVLGGMALSNRTFCDFVVSLFAHPGA